MTTTTDFYDRGDAEQFVEQITKRGGTAHMYVQHSPDMHYNNCTSYRDEPIFVVEYEEPEEESEE